jgi:hypothetical protein
LLKCGDDLGDGEAVIFRLERHFALAICLGSEGALVDLGLVLCHGIRALVQFCGRLSVRRAGCLMADCGECLSYESILKNLESPVCDERHTRRIRGRHWIAVPGGNRIRGKKGFGGNLSCAA